MYNFLDKFGDFEYLEDTEYTLLKKNEIKCQPKSNLIFCGYRNKKIRTIGVREGTNHLSRVHKQPNRIYSALGVHPTLASQEQSGRYWIYVDNKVRKLTINECYRFMGFPEDFKKIGKKSKLYERIGNSVCVPMVKNVAIEIINQIFKENINMETNVQEFLERIYVESSKIKNIDELNINGNIIKYLENIVEYEESFKGVYTVLVTSLVYKCLHKEQDIRLHQANMKNVYSGRTFDTKYITPFLNQKKFLAATKESGWLTRSLEQNLPYTLEYPGKIGNKMIKHSFLEILNDIEINRSNPEPYLKLLFYLSIKSKQNKAIKIINPINKEYKITINEIINLLNRHFYYNYKNRGASILPVIAIYSIYQCIIKESKRFDDGKYLKRMLSHTSSDRSSGLPGDINICNSDGTIYEAIDVKFEKKPDFMMINNLYDKIYELSIQRYYILSTISLAKYDDATIINEIVNDIKEKHGCQIIINGVFETIKYYLRLLKDTDLFLEYYLQNLNENPDVHYEHKIAWNTIIKNYNQN